MLDVASNNPSCNAQDFEFRGVTGFVVYDKLRRIHAIVTAGGALIVALSSVLTVQSIAPTSRAQLTAEILILVQFSALVLEMTITWILA